MVCDTSCNSILPLTSVSCTPKDISVYTGYAILSKWVPHLPLSIPSLSTYKQRSQGTKVFYDTDVSRVIDFHYFNLFTVIGPSRERTELRETKSVREYSRYVICINMIFVWKFLLTLSRFLFFIDVIPSLTRRIFQVLFHLISVKDEIHRVSSLSFIIFLMVLYI